MSVRKPLVQFDTQDHAKLVSVSMPGKKRKSRQIKKAAKGSASGRKPRVIKGRVNLRVSGYSGIQKVPPSQLIPFLPATKIRQAAKKALLASSRSLKVVKRRRTKKTPSKTK